MSETHITHFDPDPAFLEPLVEAERYQPWIAETPWSPDWPGHILSMRIVIYGDSTIARRDEPVRFVVDLGELALFRPIAAKSEAVVMGLTSPSIVCGVLGGGFRGLGDEDGVAVRAGRSRYWGIMKDSLRAEVLLTLVRSSSGGFRASSPRPDDRPRRDRFSRRRPGSGIR